jgi:hypothetical protein
MTNKQFTILVDDIRSKVREQANSIDSIAAFVSAVAFEVIENKAPDVSWDELFDKTIKVMRSTLEGVKNHYEKHTPNG